jgi:hypothetical protein
MEWRLEVSMKKQSGEWENLNRVGESPPNLTALLSDLSSYASTFDDTALMMSTPVFLKAVLRVQRSSDESFFGPSHQVTTSESAKTTRSSKSVTTSQPVSTKSG